MTFSWQYCWKNFTIELWIGLMLGIPHALPLITFHSTCEVKCDQRRSMGLFQSSIERISQQFCACSQWEFWFDSILTHCGCLLLRTQKERFSFCCQNKSVFCFDVFLLAKHAQEKFCLLLLHLLPSRLELDKNLWKTPYS